MKYIHIVFFRAWTLLKNVFSYQVLTCTMVVFLVFFTGGCRTLVIQPTHFSRQTPIYLAHYERHHTSLVVPEEKQAVEYSYGDWDLFAKYNGTLWTLFKGIVFPSQGTLGRRIVKWDGEGTESLRRALDNKENCYKISTLTVSDKKLRSLTADLDERYERHIDTRYFNPEVGIQFVKYDKSYTIWHNCNHELVRWLEELDCKIKGWVWMADFEVRKPSDQPVEK